MSECREHDDVDTHDGRSGTDQREIIDKTQVILSRVQLVIKNCKFNLTKMLCLCAVGKLYYRDRLKGVQILLSNSQAGPGRKVKQEQEEISRNHVQTF